MFYLPLKPFICFIIFRCFVLTVKFSCVFFLYESSLPPCVSTIFDQTSTHGTKSGQCSLVLNATHDLCRNTETKHGIGKVHVDLKWRLGSQQVLPKYTCEEYANRCFHHRPSASRHPWRTHRRAQETPSWSGTYRFKLLSVANPHSVKRQKFFSLPLPLTACFHLHISRLPWVWVSLPPTGSRSHRNSMGAALCPHT